MFIQVSIAQTIDERIESVNERLYTLHTLSDRSGEVEPTILSSIYSQDFDKIKRLLPELPEERSKAYRIYVGEEDPVKRIEALSDCMRNGVSPLTRHRCAMLSCLVHTQKRDAVSALTSILTAHEGLKELPEDDYYSQYITYSYLTSVNTLNHNPEAMIDSLSMMTEAALKADYRPSISVDIYNLSVSARQLDRPDIAAKILTQYLLRAETLTNDPQYSRLAKVGLVKALHETEEFEKIIVLTNEIKDKSDAIGLSFAVYRAYSLAMAERTFESQTLLSEVSENIPPSGSLRRLQLKTEVQNAIQSEDLAATAHFSQLLAKQTETDLTALVDNDRKKQSRLVGEGIVAQKAKLREKELSLVISQEQLSRQRQLLIMAACIALLLAVVLFIVHTHAKHKQALSQEIIETKEEALEAERAKTRFLGLISHELRTPLNPLVALPDILVNHQASPRNKELVQTMAKSARRLLNVVENIMFLTKNDGPKGLNNTDWSPTGLAYSVIEGYKEDIALKKAMALKIGKDFVVETKFDYAPASISGSTITYRHLMNNLIDNALKFTQTGKVVIVITQVNNGWVFAVQDTGCGIETDNIDGLFKAFEQEDMSLSRPYEGLGIGLSIVKKITDGLGASVTVETNKDEGTLIAVYFPKNTLSHSPAEQEIKNAA